MEKLEVLEIILLTRAYYCSKKTNKLFNFNKLY